jgi:uncharacterized protein YbdZ (MbtH family)
MLPAILNRILLRSRPAGFLALTAIMIAVASAEEPQTQSVDLENARDMRFCEILVIKDGLVDIYNSSGLGNCPEDQWNELDPKALASQMGVDAIQKNGPHYWVMDSQTLGLGETKSFNGIPARWGAQISASFLGGSEGSSPYKQFKTCKSQKMVYDKGNKVWEMVDSDGNVWILQAHEAQFSLQDLDDLGSRMTSLPEGWSWRSRKLEKQLVLDLKQSECNMGIGDEFHQYYTLVPPGLL